jgi:mannose-6-phosphate isomerase-like protein (cupin superfamily)
MSAIPVICPPGRGDVLTIGPARNYVKITGAEADGRLDVAEVALTPGYAGPPPHLHTRIDHIFYVLEGTLRAGLFQDHVSLRILKGRCMTRPASRLASVMSRRPARWWAPTARLRRPAMTRGPDLVRTVELSSR